MVEKKCKKKYKYTKQEFINICCSKCKICNESSSRNVCYSEFYKKHPKEFIKKIFKNLLKVKHLNKKYLEYVFKDSFCKVNLCDKYAPFINCDNMNNCFEAFRCQVLGQSTTTPYMVPGKIKKKHERYIVQPYPSFFTSGSEIFRKEIKKIVENNTNNHDEIVETAKNFSEYSYMWS